jgi:hypothetical protein
MASSDVVVSHLAEVGARSQVWPGPPDSAIKTATMTMKLTASGQLEVAPSS